MPAGCCHVYTADGRCVALFKVLLTNGCSNDCFYCQNSSSCTRRDRHARFTPAELVSTFLEFYKRNYVEGLFLSSGIPGDAGTVMHDMIEVGRLLREVHGFNGYVHMKVLPGTCLSDVRALATHADRLSLNMEAPDKAFLSEFCTTKDFSSDLLTRLAWMHGVNQRQALPAGLTTQLIIGGNEANDHDILRATHLHYTKFHLKRVYYSAFAPVRGSPLERVPAAPLMREHRLYQADWLLRCYGFSLDEVIPARGENLPLHRDPKLHAAISMYDARFPIEINAASYEELIRVPGIGLKTARRIVSLRGRGKPIEKESDLRLLGVSPRKVGPFVKINGRRHARLDEWIAKEECRRCGVGS